MKYGTRHPVAGSLALAACALGGTAAAQTVVDVAPIVVTAPADADPARETGGTGDARGRLIVIPDAFASVTVVPRDELERSQPRTLGEALQDKPGISASSFAPGGASRPILRGLDNNRVRIQENGIGAQDVSALGEDHGVPIDPLAAERVEVVRGPATLRFGSQAIGGVVSAVNNRIPDHIPTDGFSARTLGGLSSVDRGRDGAAIIDGGAGNVAVHADFSSRVAEDYRTPAGRQLNSAVDTRGGAVGASAVFDNGYFGLSYSHFASLYHIPGAEEAATNTRLDIRQDKVQSKGEIRPGSDVVEAIRTWAGASWYRHDEIGIDPATGIDGVRATFMNQEQEGRIEAQLVPWRTGLGALTTAIGAQFGHRDLGTSGEAGDLLAPSTSNRQAGYLFEELRAANGWRFQAAGRLEHVSISGSTADFPSDFLPIAGVDQPLSSRQRDFLPGSVSLGALKDLPFDLVASLTGQYVERSPEAPELFSKGTHDATGTFEIGSPGLGLEKAASVEVGLRRAVGDWRFDATAYYTRYTGFIYKRLTGVRCDDDFASCGTGTSFDQIVYSQQDATFYGAELSSQFDLLPIAGGTFGVEGQYDFVRARFDDGTDVPRIPPHRLGGGLYWRDDAWLARVFALHAFDHTQIAPNETPTPGYTNLKAELSYTTRLTRRFAGVDSLTVGLVGNNLLDDDIRNSTSFKKDEVLLPGRDVRLFATARF